MFRHYEDARMSVKCTSFLWIWILVIAIGVAAAMAVPKLLFFFGKTEKVSEGNPVLTNPADTSGT